MRPRGRKTAIFSRRFRAWARVVFLCLGLFSLLSETAFPAPAPGEIEYVLPPEARATIERAVAPPFPEPCGEKLSGAAIQADRVRLDFGEKPSFSMELRHPNTKLAGRTAGPFLVRDPTGVCPEALPLLAETLRKRRPADPWKRLSPPPSRTDPEGKTHPQAPRGLSERSPLSLALGAFVLALLAAAFGFFLCEARRFFRESTTQAFGFAGLFVLALAARILAGNRIFNWYSLTDGSLAGYDLHGFAPAAEGLAGLFSAILPVSTAVFPFVCGVMILAGALSAPFSALLAFRLRLPEESPLTGWALGGIVALWPRLVELGASDAQHALALLFWLVGALFWAEGQKGRRTQVAPAAAFAFGVVLLRVETVPWLLAWPLFFPPQERRVRFSPLILGLPAALGLSRLFHASDSGIEFHFKNFLLASQDLWLTFSSTEAGQWTLAALSLVGLLLLPAADFRRGGRILAVLAALSLPALLSAMSPNQPLVLRYFLALLWVDLWLSARGLSELVRPLKREKIVLPGLFLVLCLGAAAEWGPVFHADNRPAFRAEFDFLRTSLAEVPENTTVCMLDPGGIHLWPGRHEDFDTSFSPRTNQGRYMGTAARFRVLKDRREDDSSCDYYYESSACRLLPDGLPDPVAADIRRFREECDFWRRRLDGPAVAERSVPAASWNLPFETSRISLRLSQAAR